MFSFREAAVSGQPAYFIDKTRLRQHLRRTAGLKVRRVHLWSPPQAQSPPTTTTTNYTLEQGITRGRIRQTSSLRSFIIYVRLAAESEQRGTEVDGTNQRVKDTDVN